MGARRIYTLLIVGALMPFFLPFQRDLMLSWYAQSGVQATVEELLGVQGPATVALIREMVKQGRQPGQVVVNPVVETPSGEPIPVPATSETKLVLDEPMCTLSATEFEAILQEYGSPAASEPGLGARVLALCQEYRIDNAIVLAQFGIESTYGTAGGWAGMGAQGGATSKNPGNIICGTAKQNGCYGRFGTYETWALGFEENFRLLSCYHTGGSGREECSGLWNGGPIPENTVKSAINRWAPPEDNNDVSAYTDFVLRQSASWREVKQGQFVAIGEEGDQQAEPAHPEVAIALPSGEKVASPLLAYDGYGVYTPSCIDKNVTSSLKASAGLQSVTIAPGGDWSFNENWRDPGTMTSECYGTYGAAVCDLAGRYSNVAHQLGLQTDYVYHGFNLANLPYEDSTSIWGTPGVRGGQDLVVYGHPERTVRMAGVTEGSGIVVYGWLE